MVKKGFGYIVGMIVSFGCVIVELIMIWWLLIGWN